MTAMSVLDFRNNVSDVLNRVAYAGDRVVLQRRGKAAAVLVSVEDFETLERLENESDLKAAKAARAEGGRPIPLEKVAKRLGIALHQPNPTSKE